MKGFKLPQKGLALKHSFFWHPDCQCWARGSKGKSLPHIMPTDATQTNWITLITQRACIGNSSCPGILEFIMNWPEGENVTLSSSLEEEKVTYTVEAQHVISYQKVKSSMYSLLIAPAIL